MKLIWTQDHFQDILVRDFPWKWFALKLFEFGLQIFLWIEYVVHYTSWYLPVMFLVFPVLQFFLICESKNRHQKSDCLRNRSKILFHLIRGEPYVFYVLVTIRSIWIDTTKKISYWCLSWPKLTKVLPSSFPSFLIWPFVFYKLELSVECITIRKLSQFYQLRWFPFHYTR